VERFRLAEIFVAVAEEESFVRAAGRVGLSPPAVTRAVASLEERLGVRLLTRTTRYVRVTEAGQRFLEDARRIIGELDEAEEAARGASAEPSGHLTVTAPVLFGRLHVTQGIVAYLERYPKMTVSALFLDRVVNMLEEDVDVGVRIGELPDSSLNAIGVGHVRRVLCGAPRYFKQNGTPEDPRDLLAHTLIVSSAATPTAEWKFQAEGKTVALRLVPRLTVTNNDAAIEAALAGLGVTRLLSYQVSHLVGEGRLVTVLDRFDVGRIPVHVLHREGRYTSAKVRRFVDLMVERLRAEPALGHTA
jgi:DNA-binding transcriptional LysR family regulator